MSKDSALSSSTVDDITQGISCNSISDRDGICGSCSDTTTMEICANCGKEGDSLKSCVQHVSWLNIAVEIVKHPIDHSIRRSVGDVWQSYIMMKVYLNNLLRLMIVRFASYNCQYRGILINHAVEK